MQDGWRIIACVDPLQRILDHGFAQIAVLIALAHPFIDCIGQWDAHPADFLPDLQKDHTSARIMAAGHLLALGIFRVVDEQLQGITAVGRLFFLQSFPKSLHHVVIQLVTRFHDQLADLRDQIFGVHDSHVVFLLPGGHSHTNGRMKISQPVHQVNFIILINP